MKHNLLSLIAARESATNRRVSIAEIARDTELSAQTLYNWLNAPGHKLLRFEADTVAKLCGYFDCGIGELLEIVNESED